MTLRCHQPLPKDMRSSEVILDYVVRCISCQICFGHTWLVLYLFGWRKPSIEGRLGARLLWFGYFVKHKKRYNRPKFTSVVGLQPWIFGHKSCGTKCQPFEGEPHGTGIFSGISWVPTVVGRKTATQLKHGCLSQVSPPEKRFAPQEASFSDGFDHVFDVPVGRGGGLFFWRRLSRFLFQVECAYFGNFVLRMLSPVEGVDEMQIFIFWLFDACAGFSLVGIRMDTLFFSGMVVEGFQTLCFVVGILKVAL